jgi:hypothetical protein
MNAEEKLSKLVAYVKEMARQFNALEQRVEILEKKRKAAEKRSANGLAKSAAAAFDGQEVK